VARRRGSCHDRGTMDESAVSVMIVDDQEPFRRIAATVVDLTDGFEVVGEATTGEEAIEMAERLQPRLVLMDINMPGINGIETTRRITSAQPETTVILLSTYALEDLPSDASSCGAAGYINKGEFEPSLLEEVWERRLTGSWLR
jgi:DNA-binding NarL/FixJ family response regulator